MTVVAEQSFDWRAIVYDGKVELRDEYAGRDALRTIANDIETRAKLGSNGRQAGATRWSEATANCDYFELNRKTAIKKRCQDLVDRLAALPLAA